MKLPPVLLFLCVLVPPALPASLDEAKAAAPPMVSARAAYARADYAAAVSQLGNAADFPSLLLKGQSLLMLTNYKQAVDVLERAVALDGASSDAHLWLGRAYGRRAEKAFPTSALGFAAKAHDHFEKAVALNPRNWDALDDLFQYYLEAPAFLGGSLEKAGKLAVRIGEHDPAEAAADRGRIAEQKKDYATAEAELREAARLAPQQTKRQTELARVQAKRKAAGS